MTNCLKKCLLLACFFICPFASLFSTAGKIDLAPTFLHLDVLESGKTVNKMDMAGGKLDIAYSIYKGLILKPSALLAISDDGNLATISFGIGYYFPVTEKISVSPTVGYGYNYISTYIDLVDFGLKDLKETFHSYGPYVGVELYYKIKEDFRVVGSIQYSWSRTHTLIEHLVNSKDHSQGFNYALMVEKDLTKNFSTNIGIGYNLSLSKEKHGLRGYGVKWGFVYWF